MDEEIQNSPSFAKPLARPGQTLPAHLFGVARRAEDFAQAFGMPLAGKLVGFSHDEGKVSPIFQQYIRSVTGIFDPRG